MIDELLTQAEHDTGFLCDHLERVVARVDPVSEIVARRLLVQAVELRDGISQLRQARGYPAE